jgi:hypothetical protein
MKNIYIASLILVLGACSTQTVKCRGPLRPINKPPASAGRAPASGQHAPSERSHKEPQP